MGKEERSAQGGMEELVKSMVVYVVIGSLLKGLAASPKYSRMVQFVSGMVMMLLLLSPLLSLLRGEGDWYDSLGEKIFQMDLSEIADELVIADGAYEKVVQEEYQKTVQSQVEALAEQCGVSIRSVEVVLEDDGDGDIVLAALSVQADGAQEEQEDALREQICRYFVIGEEKVHIWN